MARLYRPHIPLSIRCEVAARQLGWNEPRILVKLHHMRYGALLEMMLRPLAVEIGCDVSELRLDHDPPLAARPRHRRGLNPKTFYTPDANDPNHLFYRPHGPQHERSHLIKTNVRGDHGQHPDRVLIKKARKLEASRNGETRRKASRLPKSPSQAKRASDSRVKVRLPKWKWPKRKFENRRKP